MGVIVSTKKHNSEQILMEVLVHKDEVRQLQGEHDDVCVFSDRVANTPSRVSLRGKNDATKYFLIPRQLRKELAVYGRVSCQKMQLGKKSVFIYVVDPAERAASFVQGG